MSPEEHVISYIKEGPYYKESEDQPDNGSIYEALTNNIVWTGDIDEHRWYSIQESVAKIEDKFIAFGQYIITGDGCLSDMDICPLSDNHLVFVEPYEVTTTDYRECK